MTVEPTPSFSVVRTSSSLVIIWVTLLIISPAASTSAQSDQSKSSAANQVDQLINESRQLMAKGTFEGIAEKGEAALKLAQQSGDQLRQSRALMYIALGRFHTGHVEEAIEPFKQSAVLAGEAGDRRLQALALRSAATLMLEAGEFDDALFFYNEALALQRSLKNRAAEGSVLVNIGSVYIATRDYQKAEEALESSLDISHELKDQLIEFSALAKLLSLELTRGNYQRALKYANDAMRITSSEIDPAMKNELRHEAALAQFGTGNIAQAAATLEQVLASAQSEKVPSAIGITLSSLAQVKLALGRTEEALATATQALALLRRSGADPSLQANAWYTIGQSQKSLGHNEDALKSLRSAIALIERARLLSVSTERSRANFFSSKSDIYFATIDLLAAAGNQDEALSIAESYHGRAFLDSLAESRADLRKALPHELLANEDAILQHISEIHRKLWQEDLSKEREEELQKELAEAESSLEEFQLEVHRANPQYATLEQFHPLSTRQIQKEMLDDRTGLIEYVLGSEKSFAWLVLKDKVVFAQLPSEKELNCLVADYRQALDDRFGATAAQSLAKLNSTGARLYQILILPFGESLTRTQRLVIVPDKVLAYLPFESLENKNGQKREYLIERFAVDYASSATAVAAIQQMAAPVRSSTLIAFGDPVYEAEVAVPKASAANTPRVGNTSERGIDLRQLPYTRTEVTNIGVLFPETQRKLFLGLQASEQNVKSTSLAAYRYIHFAAHGIVDQTRPSRSGVVLSIVGAGEEDGILQVPEIMRLKLNAELVTLSACRTGLGEVVGGEGVLGLTRAFIYAGARGVVASLWNVNDMATADLMKAFYANLKRGLAKDEALRQAKLAMLRGQEKSWRHPYYWAPFILVGSGN